MRDLTSKNYPILGIICDATHLHAAIRLESRRPDDVLKGFQDAWLRNFGYPLRLTVDDDGSFKSTFHEAMDDSGTFLDFIPPEAHHQLGTIERHIGTLRTILEKVVDSTPCTTAEEIDRALIAGVYAKNSATWSSGRPPFIAAFGKIPRVGMDFINDARGLIAGSTTAEAQQQSALMRCEAMKAIAEASASSTLRRALLRKTNPEQILEPQPGSLLAYWRWTTRSHRKRGGYRIARYLGRDPDNRTLWLQSGSQTVRVAHNQVRDVFGYEQYVPTQDDVKALHDAEQNVRQDDWVDHQAPPEVQPPELPEPGDLEFQFPEAPVMIQQDPPPLPLRLPDPPQQLQQQDQPQETEQTRQPNIQFQQNIQNTQNIFGSNPASPAAAPYAPSRRTGGRKALGRSRTPTRRGMATIADAAQPAITQTEPARLADAPAAASDPYQTQAGSTASRRAGDNQSPHDAARPGSRPASSKNSNLSQNSAVSRNAMAEAQPEQQQQCIDTIDLTGGDTTPDIGDMVPQTPPAAAQEHTAEETTMDTGNVLPSKRPFDALQARTTQARKITDMSFELYNYKPETQPPQQHLECWARLDLHSTQLQQTMSTGPPMSTVRWRRTIDAHTGETIAEGEVQEQEQDEQSTFDRARTTITELWHDKQAPQYLFSACDDALEEIEPTWDGSPDYNGPSTSSKFFEIYVNKLASTVKDFDTTISESEGEFDNMSKGMPAKTRQEQKADEKELNWREIMKQSPDYIQGFVEATQKEARSFEQWRCLRPLPPEEAEQVLNDPELKKRVINSRGCYRDKNKGVGPVHPKTRIVAQGNQDPDLRSLTRQSPTPNRVSEFLVMAIFISGINQMVFNSTLTWYLWIADAATAFLQGQQDTSERAGKLYLRAPRDGIIEMANVFKSALYEITGNLYGLSNAPVTWAREVVNRLTKLGFIVHSFDHMMFYFPDPFNKPFPCAVLICHVDDFLMTYNENFPFNELLNAFKWGSHQHAEVGKEFTYKGKEFALIQGEGKYVLKITQRAFIESMQKGKLPKGIDKSQKLSNLDWPEFRSITGCMQWLSSQSRLDIASTVSLMNHGSDATYEHLGTLYKSLEFLKQTADLGLVIHPVPLNAGTVILAYSDSSWANAQGSASQHGQVVLLAHPSVTETKSVGTLIDWKSGRSKRVCRSTLAAEAVSADSATDRLAYVSYALGELMFGIPAHKVGHRLRTLLVTDCKSLYDCVAAENPNIQDKRSLVNIRSIQELISHRTIHWVPTFLQRADCLTKVSEDLMIELLAWLQKPIIQLREDVVCRKKVLPV